MNKLYIILGFKAGISGGQIYVYNKTKYLEKHGWTVSVIDPIVSQPVYIEHLKKFENNIIKELNMSPYTLRRKERNRVLQNLINCSGWNNDFEEVVVESNTIAFSLWGELLAKALEAKHLALLIDAFFTDAMRANHMEFLSFKLDRRELAGITVNSLPELFKGYRALDDSERYNLSFTCVNSVEDIEYGEIIDKSQYDLVIGSVGRLDKPFVPDMAKSVAEFAKEFPKKEILFLILGGQASGDTTVVTNHTDGIDNLDVKITGLIYPIPCQLIKLMDVCIASSGSTYGSTKEGIKTIVVTDTCADPLGVRGYGLTESPFVNNRNYFGTLKELIEEVVMGDYCERFEYVNTLRYVNEGIDEYMKKHLDFLELSKNQKKEYFPTDKITPARFKHKIIINLKKFIGTEKTEKLLSSVKGAKNGRK